MNSASNLFSIANINLLLIIIRLCIILFLCSFLLLRYFKNKHTSSIYLTISVLLLALSEINLSDFTYNIIYTTLFDPKQIFLALLSTFYTFSIPLLSSISSIYFLFLFFKKYDPQAIKNRSFMTHKFFFIILVTGLLISTVLLEYTILQIPDRTFTSIPANTLLTLAYLALFYLVFITIGILYLFLLPLEIINILNRYLSVQNDMQLKQRVKQMRLAVLVINFGGFLGDPFSIGLTFGSTIPIIAFAFLVYLYSKNGIDSISKNASHNVK